MLLAAVRGAANVRCASAAALLPRARLLAAKTLPPAKGSGRVVLADQKARKGGRARLCGGCGTMVVKAGEPSRVLAIGGAEAVEELGLHTKAGRFSDVLDSNGFLCERCKALRHGNVWHAYDALEDLDPKVFNDQLKHIVRRRRFGLCIKVVDASDFEGTIVSSVRSAIGTIPIILAVNKIDLMPRASERDLKYMQRRLRDRGLNCTDVHAVSAHTGAGVDELAEGVLRSLGGRDVFVIGAANVGKSSLVRALTQVIAENVKYNEQSTSAKKRKQRLLDMPVTSSHLPGTTLQAIRVPCFASDRHALWDTPGIIIDKSLAYSLFPSHLMEPLAQPQPIEVSKTFRVRRGESLVLEGSWMQSPQASAQAPAFGRVDVTALTPPNKYVEMIIYSPPAIAPRVVPTSEAPCTVDICDHAIRNVQIKMSGDASQLAQRTRQRVPLVHVNDVAPKQKSNGWYAADVCFATIGWVQLECSSAFTVAPWNVKGSLWAKREPPMYPSNLLELVKRDEATSKSDYLQEPHQLDDKQTRKERLQHAAQEGRHISNHIRQGRDRNDSGWWDDDY